jgi:aldose sugar dehydrogenase
VDPQLVGRHAAQAAPLSGFARMWRPAALTGEYRRLRSVVLGSGHAPYVTTSNGGGEDRILRVTPRA